MRVLFSAVPAVGHIVPLVGLAQALQVAGHEVRFATNREVHKLLASAGLQPLEAGMSTGAMREERLRRWPETLQQPPTEWATRMWAQVMAPSTLGDLSPIIADWKPQVLVHDEGDYAGPVAASIAGIPWVTHAWGSPLRPTSELTELAELTSALWESNGLSVPNSAGLYQHALINPCPRFLQNDSPGASIEWPIRPMLLDADHGGEAELLSVDAYVGFGTVPAFANAFDELAVAVRSCTDRGLKVVVTAPNADLRNELAEIDRALVNAREFVTLSSVLPSCKIAITHAGAGTALASLSAGVPMVLVPRGTPSQIRMARACETAGVGRSCTSAWDIGKAVSEVLSNPEMASNATLAAARLAIIPAASEVVGEVEALVAR
jgi:UDP:flavonoid glycosyltransferase YjiC (YdhE family)